MINEKYEVSPEFLWDKFPGYGVFRNTRSNKWFGIIMNIDKSKIISDKSGEIEVLNVKLDDVVQNYLSVEGIYPSYHLSKKSWISIILDDTLSDKEIMDLIDISYNISNLYKCEVLEVDIPYKYSDKNVSMKKVMKIKLLKKYKADEFTFFNLPLKKSRNGEYKISSGATIRVCMTSDFFLEEADKWRKEVWEMIRTRSDITFWLQTKRAERVLDNLPEWWGDGLENVIMVFTTDNTCRTFIRSK